MSSVLAFHHLIISASSSIAECLAVLHALYLASSFGFGSIIVEFDNAALIQDLNATTVCLLMGMQSYIIADILFRQSSFSTCIFFFFCFPLCK